jgi:hypothetical protein
MRDYTQSIVSLAFWSLASSPADDIVIRVWCTKSELSRHSERDIYETRRDRGVPGPTSCSSFLRPDFDLRDNDEVYGDMQEERRSTLIHTGATNRREEKEMNKRNLANEDAT